jgi:hypothetical protein
MPDKGRKHDIEPEWDSLNYIDFEGNPLDSDEQVILWSIGAFWTVLRDKEEMVLRDKAGIMGRLVETLEQYGQVEAFEQLEALLNDAGYDTYNSDSRFEVYLPVRNVTWDALGEYGFWMHCDECGELHPEDEFEVVGQPGQLEHNGHQARLEETR